MSRKRLGYVLGTLVLLCAVMWVHHIISDFRLRGEAEINPLACALYAAERSGDRESETLCKVAVAYAEAGDFRQAEQIIGGIEETEYGAIHFLGRRIEFGGQVTEHLIRKVRAWTAVAALYAQAGTGDNALAAMSEARQIAGRIKNFYPAAEAFEAIALKYADLGEDDRALQVIESYRLAFYRPDGKSAAAINRLLTELADKYRELGRIDKSLGLLEPARQEIWSMKGVSLKISALSLTGAAYARAGQQAKSDELLSEAYHRAFGMSDGPAYGKAMYLAFVAKEYARSGNCHRAYEVVGTLIESNRRLAQERVDAECSGMPSDTAWSYERQQLKSALGFIETGDVERAIQVMQDLSKKGSLNKLVEAASILADSGNYQMAIEAVRAIVSGTCVDHLDICRSFESLRAEAVALIAIQYERDGRSPGIERRKLLSEMLALID